MEEKRKPVRENLLREAARLLAERGPDVSTRAICEAAGVSAPTLYHYFGDRAGLLTAVVNQGFSEYLARKRSIESTGHPLEDLRRGWDDHIAWGVANPSFYALMYGQVRPGQHPAAAEEAETLLLEKLEAAASAGLLRVPPELGVRMFMSANVGLTLQLIRVPDAARDGLSERMREAMIAAVSVERPAVTRELPVAAIALRSALDAEDAPLAPAELGLLDSWLDRLALAPDGEGASR